MSPSSYYCHVDASKPNLLRLQHLSLCLFSIMQIHADLMLSIKRCRPSTCFTRRNLTPLCIFNSMAVCKCADEIKFEVTMPLTHNGKPSYAWALEGFFSEGAIVDFFRRGQKDSPGEAQKWCIFVWPTRS